MLKILKKLQRPISLTIGTLLSAVFASVLTLLFHRSTFRALLPLAFVVVLVLLSRHFGVSVSLTGSLSAAIIFAIFLFPPLGSTRVENVHARMNLGWMVLCAVAVSYLLYPRTPVDSDRT
jgi:K+-sensing histidine kinase KdpD